MVVAVVLLLLCCCCRRPKIVAVVVVAVVVVLVAVVLLLQFLHINGALVWPAFDHTCFSISLRTPLISTRHRQNRTITTIDIHYLIITSTIAITIFIATAIAMAA